MGKPYVNQGDLVRRYRIFNEIGDAPLVNSTFIAPAEAEIEGRLAAKYSVPFTGSPLKVRALVLDLVWAKYMRTRDPAMAAAMVEDINRQIADLLSGDEVIVLEDGTSVGPSGTDDRFFHTQAGYKPIFDVRPAEDQRIDPDRLEAEYDEDD